MAKGKGGKGEARRSHGGGKSKGKGKAVENSKGNGKGTAGSKIKMVDILSNVFKTTALTKSDFDEKCKALFAVIIERERSDDAIKYLKDTLVGVDRTKVQHWKKYLWVLLRNFNDECYNAYKESVVRKERRTLSFASSSSEGVSSTTASTTTFSATAVEFIPGATSWKGTPFIRKTARTNSSSSNPTLPPLTRNIEETVSPKNNSPNRQRGQGSQQTPVNRSHHSPVAAANSTRGTPGSTPFHANPTSELKTNTEIGKNGGMNKTGAVVLIGLGIAALAAVVVQNRRR